MDPPAPPVPVQELLSAAVAATRISFDECLADAPHLHLKRLHALHKAVVGAKVRFTGVLAALRWQRELSGLYQEALSARDHVASTASILKDISQRFEDGQRAIVASRVPMLDVRTSIDVLANGTYSFMPNWCVTEGESVVDDAFVQRAREHLHQRSAVALLQNPPPSELGSPRFENGDTIFFRENFFDFRLRFLPLSQNPNVQWKLKTLVILVALEGQVPPPTTPLFHKLQHILLEGKGLRPACDVLLGEIKRFTRDVLYEGVKAVAYRVPNCDCPARLDYEFIPDGDTPSAIIRYWGSSATSQRSQASPIAKRRSEVIVTCASGALAVSHSPPLVDEDDFPIAFQIVKSDGQGTGHLNILNLMSQVLSAHCRSMLRQFLAAIESIPGCNLSRSDEYHVHAFWSAGVSGGLSLLVRVDPGSGMFCARSPSFSDLDALSELNESLNTSSELEQISNAVSRWVAVFASSCIRAVAASMGLVAISRPYTTPIWRTPASKITNDDRFMAVSVQLKNSTMPSQPLLWFDLASCSYFCKMFPHTNSQSNVAVDVQTFASASTIKGLIMRFLVDKNEQLALEILRDEASKCGIKWALSGSKLSVFLALGNGSMSKWMLETVKKDSSHACCYIFLSTDLSDLYPFAFIPNAQSICKAGDHMWLEDAVTAEGNAIRLDLKSLTSEVCGQPINDLNSALQALRTTVKAFPKIAQIVLELSSVCAIPATDASSYGCFSPRQLTPRSEASSVILSELRFKASIDGFGPAHLNVLLRDLTSITAASSCCGLGIGWRQGRVSLCRILETSRREAAASIDVVSPMLSLIESLLRPQPLIFDAVGLTCIWFRLEQSINRFLSDICLRSGELSKSALAVYPVSLTSVRICFMQLFWFNIEFLGAGSHDVHGSAVQQYCITDAGAFAWLRKRFRDESAESSAVLPWNRVFTNELYVSATQIVRSTKTCIHIRVAVLTFDCRCQKQQLSGSNPNMLDSNLLYDSLSSILCSCMIARFFWV
jgi:hypothetical protein